MTDLHLPYSTEASAPKVAQKAQIIPAVLAESLNRMGLQDDSLRRRLSSAVLMRAVPRFADIMVELDTLVGREGFAAGVNWVMPYFQMRVRSVGIENVPREGPVILASNHPGGADFLAIFSQVQRDDVRLVAAIEELKLLPNVSPKIIYTNRTKGSVQKRGATTEKITAELSDGRCVLLFPRGKMEPDPRWAVGSRANLAEWSSSLTRFAEAVPDLTIVPTVVSGTIARKALAMWWLRFFKSERFKQRMAIFTQVIMSMIRPKRWDVTALVQFGEPIRVADIPLGEVQSLVHSRVDELLTYSRAAQWPLRTRTDGWL